MKEPKYAAHPLRFGKLPRDLVEWEIDKGIYDVGVALGDHSRVAPFFRVPGLAHSDIIDNELAARHLVSFSSDTVADDWHAHILKRIITLAMSRLESRDFACFMISIPRRSPRCRGC